MKTTRQVAAYGTLLAFLSLGCSEHTDGPYADSAFAPTGPSFSSAAAGPPLAGSGSYVITDAEPLSVRSAGPNTIQEVLLTIEFLDGPFEGGTAVNRNRNVCRETGLCEIHILEGNFSGTVAGCDGVTGYKYTGALRARFEPPPLTASGSVTIIASKAATGAVLAGRYTIDQVGFSGSYDARYVCE